MWTVTAHGVTDRLRVGRAATAAQPGASIMIIGASESRSDSEPESRSLSLRLLALSLLRPAEAARPGEASESDSDRERGPPAGGTQAGSEPGTAAASDSRPGPDSRPEPGAWASEIRDH
jgi:hypothetical protein